jgi:hypothetical protein
MTDPYAKFLGHISRVLGPGFEEFAHEPRLIFGDSAAKDSSPLRRWAEGLADRGTSRDLGDDTWERVVALLTDPAFASDQEGILSGATWTEGRPPAYEMWQQLTTVAARSAEFDTAILLPEARAGAARKVDAASTREWHASDGLSRLDLLVVCGEPFDVRYLNVDVLVGDAEPDRDADPTFNPNI